MKIIIILLVIFASCSKSSDSIGKTCWECQVGPTKEIRKECNDGAQPVFMDANGNQLTSICKK